MENQQDDINNTNAGEDNSYSESPIIEDLKRVLPPEDNKIIKAPIKTRKKILIAALIFILIIILGSLGGYWKGINDRVNYQDILVSTEASDQMVRAIMDMDSGNYIQAISRFEYIINLDPEYPGALELLAKSLLIINNPSPTPTVTLTPTVTSTPTPDFSGKEALYQQAILLNQTEDWDSLILILDQLRFEDLNYKTGEVNILYFNALRNRGINNILIEGLLEAGIFDLNNAENFFPLDTQAINFRQWAEWYLTGASFWGVDWYQAIQYFRYIIPHAPNLWDSSFFTAKDRLATAEVIYPTEAIQRASDYLSGAHFCEANQIFQYISANYGPLSEEYWEPMLIASDKCNDLLGTPRP